jgi:hypothetical protein
MKNFKGETKMAGSEVEKAREELKRAREDAKKAGSYVTKHSGGNFVNKHIKDFSRDFDPNKDYYVALLSIVPMVGAAHWFSAEEDAKEDGTKYTIPRNCVANLFPDNSAGSNPNVCPACYLAQLESDYLKENGKLPVNHIPVDIYKGKSNGPQLLIYYYSVIGEAKRIFKEIDGKEVETSRIEWWKDEDSGEIIPYVLQIKPSIHKIINDQLDNMDAFEGDVRAYLWKFNKKSTNDFEKYSRTGPLMQNNSLVPVPNHIIEKRKDYIALLPTADELLKPTPADEMAELLELDDWDKKSSSKTSVEAPAKTSVKTSVKTSAKEPVKESMEEPAKKSVKDETELDLEDLESL